MKMTPGRKPDRQSERYRVFTRYLLLGTSNGNTLAEYSAIGTLVILASLGTLLLVGNNLTEWLGGLKSDMQSQTTITAQATAIQAGRQAMFTTSHLKIAQERGFPLADTQTLADNLNAPAPQTVGANGNTNELATELEQIAKHGLDTGTLTQTQYDLLMRMANQGHEIAALEGLLQEARSRSQGDTSVYNATYYTFKGRSMAAPDLANGMTAEATAFNDLRNQAESSGLFVDKTIGVQVENASNRILNNGREAQQVSVDATKAVTQEVSTAPSDTHHQSAVICTSGDHQDTGTQCNP